MIDLSLLPPPDVIENIDYEKVYESRVNTFRQLYPEFDALLESDPVVKLVELVAYLEVQLRARINDSARAVMLASATGADLEHLAALYGVTRLVTDPGDATAVPPIPPTMETDDSLRYRTQLAVEGMSTAGPEGAYRFHARSAHGDVADASISSPTPGQVVVTIMSNDGDGTAPQSLLDSVYAALSKEVIRPLTDEVVMQGAEIIPYKIIAELVLFPGPAPGPVIESVRASAERYVKSMHRLGYDITESGLHAALHLPGVQRVNLLSPSPPIICQHHQATFCKEITLTYAGHSDV